MEKKKIITKANLLITVIITVIVLIKFFELLYLDNLYGYISAYPWADIALVMLLIYLYSIMFAYLSRLIGIKKGIDNGYAWGLCLGLLGFIVVCALKEVENANKDELEINRYDELQKLQNLKEKGILTTDEFDNEKKKLLN